MAKNVNWTQYRFQVFEKDIDVETLGQHKYLPWSQESAEALQENYFNCTVITTFTHVHLHR